MKDRFKKILLVMSCLLCTLLPISVSASDGFFTNPIDCPDMPDGKDWPVPTHKYYVRYFWDNDGYIYSWEQFESDSPLEIIYTGGAGNAYRVAPQGGKRGVYFHATAKWGESPLDIIFEGADFPAMNFNKENVYFYSNYPISYDGNIVFNPPQTEMGLGEWWTVILGQMTPNVPWILAGLLMILLAGLVVFLMRLVKHSIKSGTL